MIDRVVLTHARRADQFPSTAECGRQDVAAEINTL